MRRNESYVESRSFLFREKFLVLFSIRVRHTRSLRHEKERSMRRLRGELVRPSGSFEIATIPIEDLLHYPEKLL